MPETDDTPRLTVDDTERYHDRVEEAAAALRTAFDEAAGRVPSTAVLLSASLRAVADAAHSRAAVPYADLPYLDVPTGETADETADETGRGQMAVGTLGEEPVILMENGLSLYDGYTPREATFPIRVLATLGVDTLVVSGAAGGLDPHHEAGDLMMVTDHINFQGANPLVGPNVDDWGPRFPDMSEPYDPDLRRQAADVALDHGIQLHKGVYLAVLGPNLETAAEYRMLRTMGADAVGMGLVPEVLVARHMDVRVLALTVITDVARPDALEPVSLGDIRTATEAAIPPMTTLLKGVVGRA